MAMMRKIYLVCWDALLATGQRQVVGSTPQEMLDAGYQRRPFFQPHPQTHEEYALARAERKSAGYCLPCRTDVTPEDDLLSTINAAQTITRYRPVQRFKTANVCCAMFPLREDPRAARSAFAARYAFTSFRIADEFRR